MVYVSASLIKYLVIPCSAGFVSVVISAASPRRVAAPSDNDKCVGFPRMAKTPPPALGGELMSKLHLVFFPRPGAVIANREGDKHTHSGRS